MDELTTTDCRYLAFFMIDGSLMARASTARDAIETAMTAGLLDNADALEVLDCRNEGRKIWLHNRGTGMPIFLSAARKRHKTVFRGNFYDDEESQKPAIALADDCR